MCERAVSFSHTMHIFFALERTTLFVISIHNFRRKFLCHGFTTALTSEIYHIFHRNRLLAIRTDFSRNLECCTTDSTRLNLYLRSDFIKSRLPDFKDGNLQFVNKVTGGNIPKEFIPSVQKGFESAMKNGVLGGYPMVGLKVELLDGSFHPVDSDQLSFEVAAINAYKNACSKAGPALMEPIMRLEVVCPEENMGDVIGDLNKRRGQVEGMDTNRSGGRIVKALVPLAETFGYVTTLRTITSGRATSSMQYDHHAPVSTSIAEKVLEEIKGHTELLK